MNSIDNVSALLDLMSAYQKSRVLFSFVELEVPEMLSGKTLSARQIAHHKKIDFLAMERFLNACVSLGLLEKQKNKYKNTKTTEIFLVKTKKFYLGGQVERHRKRSYPVWSKLTSRLQEWKTGDEKKSIPESEDQGAKALVEQHNLALLHGFELAKNFDFSKFNKLLDLGGGTGAMSIALCHSYPKLTATIFELPENTKTIEKFIKREKLQNPISVVGGDLKKDALPEDFDAVLLANFMAVADPLENKKLLKKLYKLLPPKGACILSGWILDKLRLSPQIPVLFCLEDICWDAPDVERSEQIYTKWLKEAGFSKIKSQTYLEPTKILYGFKL